MLYFFSLKLLLIILFQWLIDLLHLSFSRQIFLKMTLALFYCSSYEEWLQRSSCCKTMLAKDVLMLVWRHKMTNLQNIYLMSCFFFFFLLHHDIEFNFDLINHSVLVVQRPSKNLIVGKSTFDLYGQHSCSFPGTVRDSTCYLFSNENWRPWDLLGWGAASRFMQPCF